MKEFSQMTPKQILLDCAEGFNLNVWNAHIGNASIYGQDAERMALAEIYNYRQDYYNAKIELANRVLIDEDTALSLTNAQLVARVLDLKKKPLQEEYHYTAPFEIEVGDDPTLATLMQGLTDNYSTLIAGCEVVFSRGGVHGSSHALFSLSTPTTPIYYCDLSSFYPSLIKTYKYLDNKVFDKAYKDHMANKTPATKLLLNTVSGLLELYDPKSARDMRNTGQILIYLLLKDIVAKCPSFKLLNLNTDGLIYTYNAEDSDTLIKCLQQSKLSEVSKWDLTPIDKIWIKDVNNYVALMHNGKTKVVGILKYGINDKGKFSINNNGRVIKEAVIWAMREDKDPRTIVERAETDRFMFIANGGDKAESCWWNGKEIPIISRVYATTNNSLGSVYFKPKGADTLSKLPNIPEHCFVGSAEELDKEFYISEANKLLKQYGYKPNANTQKEIKTKEVEPMAEETKPKNILAKLCDARLEFLNSKVVKSGKNSFLKTAGGAFNYFTLDDIIPTITKIFNKIGLLGITTFDTEKATLIIFNTDDPNQSITFTSPMPNIQFEGRTANEMQLLGAVETYQRRYLYLVALDIVEPETFDAEIGVEPLPAPTPKQAVASAPQTREQAKTTLNTSEGQADPLRVQGLEKAIATLLQESPTAENIELVNKIYAATNHLKNITNDQCDKQIAGISKLLEKVEASK